MTTFSGWNVHFNVLTSCFFICLLSRCLYDWVSLCTGAIDTDATGNYLKLAEFINLDYYIRTDGSQYRDLAAIWVLRPDIHIL